MDQSDLDLRNLTYQMFVELGRAPSADEVAGASGLSQDSVVAGWRRLHDAHALVLTPGTAEIRMANPFSAVPTSYRVRADERWWYANCAWDAFGIGAAMHVDGHIETSCPDCREPITVETLNRQPDGASCSFTASFPHRSGGTTLCSLEAP